MINKIISAIADNIKLKFENINIYTEKVKQGFEKPCFSIICTNCQKNIYRGQRYRLNADIEIHYYSSSRDDYNDVMLKLFDIINYIEVDSYSIRAVKMSMTQKEDCCLFAVGYDFFCYMEEEKEMMGEYMEKLNII